MAYNLSEINHRAKTDPKGFIENVTPYTTRKS